MNNNYDVCSEVTKTTINPGIKGTLGDLINITTESLVILSDVMKELTGSDRMMELKKKYDSEIKPADARSCMMEALMYEHERAYDLLNLANEILQVIGG